jgi:hypothetical protein
MSGLGQIDWVRQGVRLMGVILIGGGATGFLTTVTTLTQVDAAVPAFITLAFCIVYLLGIVIGIELIEGNAGAIRIARTYQLAQAFWVQTSVIGYVFWCGFSLPVGTDGNLAWIFGSTWHIGFMQSVETTVVGVNLFALASAAFLHRLLGTA